MEPQPEPTGSTLKQLVTVPSACTSSLTDQDGQRTCPICFTDDLVVPQMDTEEEDTEESEEDEEGAPQRSLSPHQHLACFMASFRAAGPLTVADQPTMARTDAAPRHPSPPCVPIMLSPASPPSPVPRSPAEKDKPTRQHGARRQVDKLTAQSKPFLAADAASKGRGNPSESPQGGGNPSESPQGRGNPWESLQGGGNPSESPQGGGNPWELPQGGGNPWESPQAVGATTPAYARRQAARTRWRQLRAAQRIVAWYHGRLEAPERCAVCLEALYEAHVERDAVRCGDGHLVCRCCLPRIVTASAARLCSAADDSSNDRRSIS